VLFAEATERALQRKRAFHCVPDAIDRVEELLATYVPKDAELVVATTWGQGFSSYLGRQSAAGRFALDEIAALPTEMDATLAPPAVDRAFLASLHGHQRSAGLGVVIGMERAFGAVRLAGLRRYRHHLTHAALGAYGGPFDEAACLVVDGVGESGSLSLFHFVDGALHKVPGTFGTVSPGLLYSLLTEACGFDPMAGEEWKVMGLAPYGRPDPHLDRVVQRLWRVGEQGQPLRAGAAEVRGVLADLAAARPPGTEGEGWPDLARAAQDAFGRLMDGFVAEAHRRLPLANLVLTGGCALNSSCNGRILARSGFERLHVPSAPADDGNAVGAALLAWIDDHPGERPAVGRRPLTPYLGSTMSTRPLERMRAHEPRLVHVGEDIVERTAALLADGLLVGWAQGRAEFGPRALGNRSILADPRPAGARDTINAKVKYREAFRPFAPSILADRAADWFDDAQASPYMDRTLSWRPAVRDRVPAVVHADGTGRLQTVTAEANPRYHQLLVAFERLTGVPVLLNTSLNVMGRPIAHATEDALTLFYTTGLDALVVGDWLLTKT
jgi:carbamoyltransferase